MPANLGGDSARSVLAVQKISSGTSCKTNMHTCSSDSRFRRQAFKPGQPRPVTKQNLICGILMAGAMGLFPSTFSVRGTQSEPARPAIRSETIPVDQIGAVAGRQYSGDGLALVGTAAGAHLRCVFQRLEGKVTCDGLWLTSIVTETVTDRFQVKATVVERGASNQALSNQPSTTNIRLPDTGTISVDGRKARFDRPGLIEEYSVSLDGVRQDFVVTQRPGGTGELLVRLEVAGARVGPANFGAQLVLEKSGRKIAYSRLRVTDANGCEFPARIEVVSAETMLAGLKPNADHGSRDAETGQSFPVLPRAGRELVIIVKDVDAVYPLHIDPTFSDANWVSLGGIPAANGRINALAVDSSGNLYVGGYFTVIGDTRANDVAKWSGSSWSALGPGISGGNGVFALAVSGSNVYAGGSFYWAGANSVNNIAKWDGTTWSGLGPGTGGAVSALAVSGTNLYAGGDFSWAGGIPQTVGVARWDGSFWWALGTGISGAAPYVNALAVSGSNVYVGGTFTNAGGALANQIAKWNGSSWSALGSGMGGNYPNVLALAVSGTDLYAGGHFAAAGGIAASNIARWNGTSWSALGSGVNGDATGLAVSGSTVYVSGGFTNAGSVAVNHVARWNGGSWSALGSGLGSAGDLALYGSTLFASVVSTDTEGLATANVLRWNGSSWLALLSSGIDSPVLTLAVSGNAVFAGGRFKTAGAVAANHVAKWDGTNWSALGKGMDDTVYALATLGTNLYAGGDFVMATNSGGAVVRVNSIAKWNGSSWSSLGSGMSNEVNSGTVHALAISDSNLYAGGDFSIAGGNAASNVAKWDGTSWSALGPGIGVPGDYVEALAVSGSNIYAGGSFTNAGGILVGNIAVWNGSIWSPLSSGMNGGNPTSVRALAVVGSDLFAGGNFTTAGGRTANFIAKWDGNNWSAVGPWGPFGPGLSDPVYALAVSGNSLFVGGAFTLAGTNSAYYVAQWDGTNWIALGSGTDESVCALAVSGSDLFVGGYFTVAGDKVSGYAARAVSVISIPLVIVTTDGLFGFTSNQFRFRLTGPMGSNAVVQASTNLQVWTPLQTNSLAGGTANFTDSKATNYLWRFYRALLQP